MPNYTKITSSTTTVVKTTPGLLRKVIVSGPGTTWTIQIFDNTAGSGTAIFGATAVTIPAAGTILTFDVNFNIGLTVVTSGTAGEITVTWE